MYSAVLRAQVAAMKKISRRRQRERNLRSGGRVILKKGFDVGEKGFVHGLGHGVGLDIHEKPSLKAALGRYFGSGERDHNRAGIILSKVGGVRIEDMVLVTKTGCKNLTNYPKKLIIP